MNFKEIFEMADFEVKVRYNHLDERLCDIDDELMALYVDQTCTELDIEIAEALEDEEELNELYLDLADILEEIDRKEIEYDVVSDFFDRELVEILSIAERVERNRNSIFN